MRIFTFLSALAVVMLFFPTTVHCQITRNWATGYAASSASNAHITTDGSGNIYIAANTSVPAYTLIKYNSAGTPQWATTGASGTSQAGSGVVGVGTDNSGNVYLVSNGASGILVVAYNPSGAQLWSTMLNTGGRGAGAHVMAVNGSGNVFIGGQIDFSTTSSTSAYMTARVSGGVQKYLSTFEGSANQFSYVTGIACDNSGNAYVTGTSVGAHTYLTRGFGIGIIIRRDTSFDMTTLKYDSSGNAAWTNVYNAGINVGDFGFSVAVDPSSGNVYALGQSQVNGLVGDLVAYSSTGSQLWVYQNSTSPNDESIAIDPSGNIITGGTYYFNISKYTSGGSLTWSYSNSSISLLGNESGGYLSMALDKSGNCYITSPLSNVTDYFTAEISSAGSLAWSTTYSTGGSGGSSGIAIYTPVSRFGMIVYPQVNVTGNAANGTNFTTIQYTYRPINTLSYHADSLTGLDDMLARTPPEQLFNYPNPFHGSTMISYSLFNDSHVTLQIYDQSGKLLATLFEGDQKAGTYKLPFTSSRLAAGIYHYRIAATSSQGNFIQTKQMLIL